MNNLTGKIEKIEGKVEDLFKQMVALEAEAKSNLAKSKESKGSAKEMYKQRCLIALKKKKAIENQVKSYNAQQNLLQQAVFTAETVNSHKQMYEGLKNAVDTQKEAMKGIDIDKMDDLHDQMIDMKMQSDLMNQMLNRNYEVDIDEDEFEDQFKEFEKEVAIEKKKNPIIANKKQEVPSMDIDAFLK